MTSSLSTTLVLGGARSGKSAFAEGLVREANLPRIYVATATAGDEDMRQRIARHRLDRGQGWCTIEEPIAIVEILACETKEDCAILIDCLTLWLSNLMLGGHDVEGEIKRLAQTVKDTSQPIILVSNEVGLGLVPETALGRDFRDAQGHLNQAIAAAVPNVAFIAAGLPLWLKRTA